MITFYYGSGSPYAWRVWLALEHKALPYEMKVLSFSAGDTRKPEFVALNPRHKVPVIVDDGFVLYESAAIIEYLEDRYPSASGKSLWPADVKQRAIARRLAMEVDTYLHKPESRLLQQAFFTKPEARNADEIASAASELIAEYGYFENALQGDFLAGTLSAADFTLYPHLAMLARVEQRSLPTLGAMVQLGPRLQAWHQRMEALPFMGKTRPPHWK